MAGGSFNPNVNPDDVPYTPQPISPTIQQQPGLGQPTPLTPQQQHDADYERLFHNPDGTFSQDAAGNPIPVDPYAQLPGESNSDYLIRIQIQGVKDSAAEDAALRPYTLMEMGLIEDNSVPGGIRPLTEDEKINGVAGNPIYTGMTQQEKDTYTANQIFAKHTSDAAQGLLDVPTYVQDAIDKQRTSNDILLSQRLGPGGAHLSTAGANSRSVFDTSAAATKNAYNFGQESTGMGLLSGYNSYLADTSGKNQATYGSISTSGLGLIPSYSTANQPYTFGKQLQNENEQMGVNRDRSVYQGLLGGVGAAAGIVASKV